MQVASKAPFLPFAAHASDQQGPFFTLSRSANSLRGVFSTLSRHANSLRGLFFTFSRSANCLRGPFSILSRSANCLRGSFSTVSRSANCLRGVFFIVARSANCQRGVFFIVARSANCQRGPFSPLSRPANCLRGFFSSLHGLQTLSRGVRFLLAPLARLLQEVFLPIHQRYLPPETSFFLLFFTPTIAIPHPLSRENHPKIQKNPPFCSSLAILTAKIPPFPQLERKEGWQTRRCPKGKNKKAALKKGESYTSLGGESGFMLVDWKGAPQATIKTTARSPALPLIRRE